MEANGGPPSGGAVHVPQEALVDAEVQAGLRCVGCQRRIEEGIEFIRFALRAGPDGLPEVREQRAYTCGRDDCDAADKATQHATAMRGVFNQWLEEEPEEGAPATVADAPRPLQEQMREQARLAAERGELPRLPSEGGEER